MEKNYKALRRALDRLPQYDPPAGVWNGIDRALTEREGADPLREALDHLPQYEPPPELWAAVAAGLSRTPPRRLRPVYRLRRIAAGAATLAVLGLGWWWNRREDPATVSLTYSREVAPAVHPVDDWDDDAAAFATVLNVFKDNPLLRENEVYRGLLAELAELDSAKQEITAMMDSYGRDGDLVREMGRLERERAGVLKELAALLQQV